MPRLLRPGGLIGVVIVVTAVSIVHSFDGQGRGQGRGGGRGAARTRKAVLAWADTRNGIAQHDSVSHALAVIERLGYESGAYDTFIRTDSNIIANEPNMTTGPPATGGSSPPPLPGTFFLWRPGDAPRAQPSNRLGQW